MTDSVKNSTHLVPVGVVPPFLFASKEAKWASKASSRLEGAYNRKVILQMNWWLNEKPFVKKHLMKLTEYYSET